jgi:hypothetical protein
VPASHTAVAGAAVFEARTLCQEADSDEEGDADAMEAAVDAEEELVSCAADAMVALIGALGAKEFAEAWQVCMPHTQAVSTLCRGAQVV